MRVVRSVTEMQKEAEELRRTGKRLGLVPTMGYLHAGHSSLMKIAAENSDVLMTTVFVNPTQFGPNEDFERYPRDLKRDEKLAAEAGTDILFVPEARALYPEGYQTFVVTDEVAGVLEGKIRPIHFRGVTTIVAKLFNITRPHVAVFGQKDAQQAFIIRKMVRDLNYDINIIVAPIVRETDGLALSSRNAYLSPTQRPRATSLFKALTRAEAMIREGERNVVRVRTAVEDVLSQAAPDQVDYVAIVRPETFREVERVEPPGVLVALAVRFGSTRLIDNMIIPVS